MTAPEAASSGLDEPPVGRLFADFVAALQDPLGGGALYDLHAPEAPFPLEGQAVRLGEVSRERFAALHEESTRALAMAGLGFPGDRPYRALGHATRDTEAVAWFELDDPAAGAPVRVALGAIRQDAGWKIAWTALVPDPNGVDFARAHALAHAEFPFLAHNASPANRSWLDVAYRRRFQRPRPKLQLLAGERFGCHGSSTCCVGHVDVTVPAAAQAMLDAIPWEGIAPALAGRQLEPRPDGSLLLVPKGEPCPYLDEARRCRIHSYLGTPVFTPCVVFPFRFTETPEGVAVTGSFLCDSVGACQGPPVAQREADLYERLEQAGGPMFAQAPLHLVSHQQTDWETFKAAEQDLRDALRLPDLALHRRLWVGTRALAARLAGEVPVLEAYAGEEMAPLDAAARKQVESHFRYAVGLLAMLDDGFAAAQDMQINTSRLVDEARAARWFEQIHFAKDLAYRFGLSGANTLVLALYAFMLALQRVRGPMSQADFRTMAVAIDHRRAITGFQKLLELVPELIPTFDDPAMGLALLRYVADAERATVRD